MYSKALRHATLTLSLLFAVACSSRLPWHDEPVGQEINTSFVFRDNLIHLPTATVDGRPGRFVFGSAQQQTVLDTRFAQSLGPRQFHTLQLNGRESLRFRPVVTELQGVADGIIGADVWGLHAVTIDYRAGLLTFQREGIHPDLMNMFTFRDAPSINVAVDGRLLPAIIDTLSPDTLVLPRSGQEAGRRTARVQIAGFDLGVISVRLADVSAPRIGNLLLSKFLVSIDYGRREVGLWRDPRTR